MTQTLAFNSQHIEEWARVPLPTQGDVRDTKQLFQADWSFAEQHGGAFVRHILATLYDPAPGYEWVIDTKVHMLKERWYPGIPGWHLDFAPNWEGIVDFSKLDAYERHYCTISDGCSATEFLDEEMVLNVPPMPKINGYLSRQLAALQGTFRTQRLEPGTIYGFTQLDLHRVTAATRAGWRLFVRASHTRLRKPTNEIRVQGSQIYLLASDEHAGW